jgi:hypothetical protein
VSGFGNAIRRRLGPITRERAEARSKFDAEVERRSAVAEAALRGDAHVAPDIIYSGLQEAGIYSADPELDACPEVAQKAIKNGTLLRLVKEFSVSPSGDWEVALPEARIKLIEDGVFCVNCNNPQPQSDEEWEPLMQRLEGVIGHRPEGASRECNCPYCGFKLGIHGIVPADCAQMPAHISAYTREQQVIIHEMFPGVFDEEGNRILFPSDQADDDEENGDAIGDGADQSGSGRDGAAPD